MRTDTYEQIQDESFDEECEKDKNLYAIAYEYYKNIKKNYYTDIDWFGQYWDNSFINVADAHTFGMLHSWAGSGNLTFCTLYVNHTPNADKDIGWNNGVLQNLPKPFNGKYGGGGNADDDGWISWNEPIKLNVFDINGIEHRKELNPGKCPLEVGYTKFIRTYFHLAFERILARWPYGSNKIIVMKLDDDFADRVCQWDKIYL